MWLYVEELNLAPRYQIITVGRWAINLTAVRPHLYRALNPAGSVFVRIEDTNNNLIALSNTVPISSIGNGNYWHGYIEFDVTCQLKANASYAIHVVPTNGYVYDPNTFVGVCNDFDLRKAPATYSPNTGVHAALDIELWENQFISRRAG